MGNITLPFSQNELAEIAAESGFSDPISEATRAALDLIGAKEFKRYLCDTMEVATHMSGGGEMFVFERAVLFSINDGDGLHTQLRLLARLWEGIWGIKKIPVTYKELRLPDRMDAKSFEKLSDRDIVLANLSEDGLLSPSFLRVLCLDITKWIERVERSEFRAALSRLRNTTEEQLVVFRVPAVDELTLRRLREAIGWFFNVDVVYTPPCAIDDYYAYALQRVEKRGLELDGEAREALRRALELRRGSGGFWGFHSVDVLIDDMLFAALRGKYAL
ncbi:MAG: hypothetical protein J5449_04345 [Oscillospiraceae bacterium]|nr:hypothetical protein [Oscillospiraceae bacterium]